MASTGRPARRPPAPERYLGVAVGELSYQMAESMPREEYERLLFFESAREQAEAEWSENNRDTQARLVRDC